MSSGTSSRLKAKKPPRRRPANAKARSRLPPRSEERRVGKECRSRGSPYQYKKKAAGELQPRRALGKQHRVGAEHRVHRCPPVATEVANHVGLLQPPGRMGDGPIADAATQHAGT